MVQMKHLQILKQNIYRHVSKKLKGLDIEMVATVKKDRVERQKSGDFDISCARWDRTSQIQSLI